MLRSPFTQTILDRYGPCPLPVPTDAEPGSPAKIAVLEARALAGQQLHHPDDRKDLPVRLPRLARLARLLAA
jgi:hypothetical protein